MIHMKTLMSIVFLSILSILSSHGQNNIVGYSLTNESINEFKPEVFYARNLAPRFNTIVRISYRSSEYTANDLEGRVGLHYDFIKCNKFILDLGYEIGVDTYAIDDKSFSNNRRIIHNLPLGVRYQFSNKWMLKFEYTLTNSEQVFNNLAEISLLRLSIGYSF
jgi:hypothetical protein